MLHQKGIGVNVPLHFFVYGRKRAPFARDGLMRQPVERFRRGRTADGLLRQMVLKIYGLRDKILYERAGLGMDILHGSRHANRLLDFFSMPCYHKTD